MRTPEYLSPTSVSLFYSNLEEFYLKYLAENRPPRMPQTQPMSVGSAFDAFVKSYIYEKFYGVKDPAFALDTLFEAQVEPQNRDFAREAGLYCFNCYKDYGVLADLMLELNSAVSEPMMEFTAVGRLQHRTAEVPLTGKPDLKFETKDGAHVIYDWKVNGYCGKGTKSPEKGYIMVRGREGEYRGLNAPHKEAMIMRDRGVMINVAHNLEIVSDTWANQLAIYGWLIGEEIGGDFIVGIDQLVFGNPGRKCRIATHRTKVGRGYQLELFDKIAWCWKVIQSGHIFRELSLEDSKARQAMLDNQYLAYADAGKGDVNEDWFRDMSRKHSNF